MDSLKLFFSLPVLKGLPRFSEGTLGHRLCTVIFFPLQTGNTHTQVLASGGKCSRLPTACAPHGMLAGFKEQCYVWLLLVCAGKANWNATFNADTNGMPLPLLGFILGLRVNLPKQMQRCRRGHPIFGVLYKTGFYSECLWAFPGNRGHLTRFINANLVRAIDRPSPWLQISSE